MTMRENLHRYGLTPKPADLGAVRQLLRQEIEAERAGQPRAEDLALLCSVQLFSRGELEDALLIWEAKRSSMDLGSYLDVQLLCGAGLETTQLHQLLLIRE